MRRRTLSATGIVPPEIPWWKELRRKYEDRDTERVVVSFKRKGASRRDPRIHAEFTSRIDFADAPGASIKGKLRLVHVWCLNRYGRQESCSFTPADPEWNAVCVFAAKGIGTKRRHHGVQKSFTF